MSSSQVWSIYRSLLREATYLPDEAARSYFRHWIAQRFRTAAAKPKPDRDGFRKARKALYHLQRANHGQDKALQWVLNHTYARIGRRRRELMDQLRAHGDEHLFPENDSAIKSLLQKSPEPKPTPKSGLLAMNTKLQTLIKSQQSTSFDNSPRTDIKKIAEIPALNSWQRPLPLKLRAGKHRRWLAHILDKVLPPLPQHEHQRLHNLATGILPFPGLPSKRPGTAPRPPAAELISAKEIARLLQPIAHVEKQAVEDSHANHRITPRYMRRHWMRVLRLCPVMAQDERTKRWDVTWLSSRSLPVASVVTTASASDLELFEGDEGAFEAPKITKKFRRQLKRKHIAIETL